VLSASKTQLTFNSNEAINSNLSLKGTVPITVTTLGKSTNISANIDYHGLWTSIGGPGADNRLESFQFTVNGKGYFGGGTYNGTSYRDVWEYDPATNHWTRMADYPGIATAGYVFFSTGTRAYVGMGQGPGPSFTEGTDWWEFDPSLNKWTAKAAYPGTGRHYLTIFTVNGTGYVGGGKDLNYVSHKDFWAYDSSSDTWKAKADLPASLLFTEYPPSFGLNGLGYTFNFDVDFVSATRTQRLHIYDPTSNSWTTNLQHQSPPEMPAEIPLVFSNFVVIGNYVFDPITDQIKSFNNYDNNRTFRCRFAIGNAGYFGLGFNINASMNDFYWLDTTKL
jgi:hypothetical protein